MRIKDEKQAVLERKVDRCECYGCGRIVESEVVDEWNYFVKNYKLAFTPTSINLYRTPTVPSSYGPTPWLFSTKIDVNRSDDIKRKDAIQDILDIAKKNADDTPLRHMIKQIMIELKQKLDTYEQNQITLSYDDVVQWGTDNTIRFKEQIMHCIVGGEEREFSDPAECAAWFIRVARKRTLPQILKILGCDDL